MVCPSTAKCKRLVRFGLQPLLRFGGILGDSHQIRVVLLPAEIGQRHGLAQRPDGRDQDRSVQDAVALVSAGLYGRNFGQRCQRQPLQGVQHLRNWRNTVSNQRI